MLLQIFGLNHNTAPVQIRERIIFSGDDVTRALSQLLNLDGIEEVVLLSTCNRTEFYVISNEAGAIMFKNWLQNNQNLDAETQKALFTLQQNDAIKHIFRVACGLDSMVLGEPQILGQLKDAYRQAQQAGSVGSQLSRLFQHTFSVAKKVRSDTKIGNSPVSVAYATVTLANQFFAGFSQHTALLIAIRFLNQVAISEHTEIPWENTTFLFADYFSKTSFFRRQLGSFQSPERAGRTNLL